MSLSKRPAPERFSPYMAAATLLITVIAVSLLGSGQKVVADVPCIPGVGLAPADNLY